MVLTRNSVHAQSQVTLVSIFNINELCEIMQNMVFCTVTNSRVNRVYYYFLLYYIKSVVKLLVQQYWFSSASKERPSLSRLWLIKGKVLMIYFWLMTPIKRWKKYGAKNFVRDTCYQDQKEKNLKKTSQQCQENQVAD